MRAGNIKLAALALEKQLQYHPEKSGYLIFGSEGYRAACRMDAQEAPIMLGDIIMKEKEQEKYLRDILNSKGLSASVEATIKEREAKTVGAIYELRALTEDFRMQAVGGCQSAINMYETCIIPSLLSNAGTWVEMDEAAFNKLDDLQDTFGRAVLSLPLSAPLASLRAALGLPGMKWRVWEQKILLIQAIRQQEEGGLASEVLKEQVQMGWPGLAQEVKQICQDIQLPDATKSNISKEDIKKAIKYDHLKALKLQLTGRKLKLMANSDIRERREYTSWSLLECRMAYRLETQMFLCRANMPSMYGRDLTCRACTPGAADGAVGPEEDQDHLEVCPGYASLWAGLGPMTIQSRVNFFMRVDKRRRQGL